MQMIAHHRIGMDRDGEAFCQQMQAALDSVLAMFEALACVAIGAAEECPADATLHAMEATWSAGRRELKAWFGHAHSMNGRARLVCWKKPCPRVGVF